MRTPNRGTVLGFLALFVALSGASYAAVALPKNSVTTKQVKDHSLLKRDFKSGQIPRGAPGPAGTIGPQGPTGPQGPPGPTNTATLTKVTGPSAPVCASSSSCAVASSAATCPAGTRVVSGGFFNFSGGTVGEYSDASSDRTAWTAGVANGSSYGGGNVQAFAYCANAGAAVTARHRSMTARTRRDIAQRETRLREVLHRSGCHRWHSCPSDHGTYRWHGMLCWKAGADDRPAGARKRVLYQGLTYYCKG